MRRLSSKSNLLGFLLLLAGPAGLLSPAAGPALAQRVPVRRYDVADGLAHSRVTAVLQDHLGYLWMGTWEGLSRFDGYRFTNYGQAEGLRNPGTFDIAEDSRGRLWVANWGGGLARLDDASGPGGRAHFTLSPLPGSNRANEIWQLTADRHDRLWCLSPDGLFRADVSGEAAVITRIPEGEGTGALALDDEDTLWLGRGRQLCRWDSTGARVVGPPPGIPLGVIIRMVRAPRHRLLVADSAQVYEVTLPQPGSEATSWHRLPLSIPPMGETQEIRCLWADSAGSWVGTRHGLFHWDGVRETRMTRREGLADDFIRTLFRDDEGNLWIGTDLLGVSRLSSSRVTNFLDDPDTPDRNVLMSLTGSDNRLYAVTSYLGLVELENGAARPLPGSREPLFRALNYRVRQDDDGAWWVGTDAGLFRFPGPELRFEQGRHFGPADGLPHRLVLGLWQDPVTRRLWVGGDDRDLYSADPRGGAATRFTKEPFPALPEGYTSPRQMGRDSAGGLWFLGFRGIVRLHEARYEEISAGNGLPENQGRCLFTDRRGRLWIGLRNHGAVVTADPGADHPSFTNYSVSEGLASNSVWWIADDAEGNLYLATGRGVNRIELNTGQITTIDADDGLPGGMVQHVRRDSAGALWFSTSGGLSRFEARDPPPAAAPPPIFLNRITIAGEDQPLPERGVRRFGPLTLRPGRNNLQIGFVGLRYGGSTGLRYEYRLAGAEREFGAPTDQRAVNYARLTSGRYRFEVRAIDVDGRRSPAAATLDFSIPPPVWRRAWFLALVLGALGGLAFLAVRFRVRQIVALERLRRQIALDLHDEVGSGLVQIAILNEVARREAPAGVSAHLEQAAELARELRASMSDIVWAVDPRRDRLLDLAQRMRQFAYPLFEGGITTLTLRMPYDEVMSTVPLGPDKRRHLLLVFKEALTNVARHALAAGVVVTLELDGGQLTLTIADDGCGFDTALTPAGNGLGSLTRRAAELGGRLDLTSERGVGTRLCLVVPLRAAPPA